MMHLDGLFMGDISHCGRRNGLHEIPLLLVSVRSLRMITMIVSVGWYSRNQELEIMFPNLSPWSYDSR